MAQTTAYFVVWALDYFIYLFCRLTFIFNFFGRHSGSKGEGEGDNGRSPVILLFLIYTLLTFIYIDFAYYHHHHNHHSNITAKSVPFDANPL